MAEADQFTKGMYLLIDGTVHYVEDRRLKTQGRQGGLIILKMRTLPEGNVVNKTVKAGTKLEVIQPEYREVQYLYEEGDFVNFMDTETYESLAIKKNVIGEYNQFLKEGEVILVMFFEGKAIDIKRNPTVVLEVTEAEAAVKGDTANNALKQVTTETGYKLKVPMFVEKGDKVQINTETGEYMKRI